MLRVVLLSEKSVALLFQCQFVKAVFLTCGNKTSIAIFQKIVPNVNSANFWNVPLVVYYMHSLLHTTGLINTY